MLDSGSNPSAGANIGNIKFNISTNAEGEKDRLVITPTTSIFYNSVGIGKTPGQALDISGSVFVSANIYNKNIISSYSGVAGNVNVLARLTGTINLTSEQGSINFNTNSIDRLSIDPSGFIFAYNNFDVSGNMTANDFIGSGNMTASNFIGSGAQLTSLNASNITSGTLSVSRGGTGSSSFTANRIILGNGTSALKTSANLIFDTSANGLGIGVTQLRSQTTSLQVKDRRLWIESSPNNSISILSTEKYGTATTESYIQMTENLGMDFRVKSNGFFAFRCATDLVLDVDSNGIGVKNLKVSNINLLNALSPNNSTMTIRGEIDTYDSRLILGSGFIGSNPANSYTDTSSCQVITKRNNLYIDAASGKNININTESNGKINSYGPWAHTGDLSANNINVGDLTVLNNIITSQLFGANATAKNLIKFTTKAYNGLFYYNLQIDKYYKTGQNINGNDYKIFNLTSWAEDGFSIINKCTVYISSQGSGIKYIMFYDNWGSYLPNGNQSGWQRDTNTAYMSFISTTQKNIITILENLL